MASREQGGGGRAGRGKLLLGVSGFIISLEIFRKIELKRMK
jgi:hypothetical protein